MSVRVVARIRPLLKAELERDIIVEGTSSNGDATENSKNLVRISNPKNAAEDYNFQFSSVYDAQSKQEDIFQNEVAPTLKHLFQGLDVTLFAYGVTGTGKTHTMRGGKSLAERGVIPRLLSGIYRRSRKLEKDAQGATAVEVAMSYYEIYNDRVFDLFEAPEKRTATGLPLREQNGKTLVVGLTERPCTTLKEFESLYDHANVNRSTSATKLNAHSSRSHAILRVKVTITTGDETRVSTVSAIDLAGSEDNRRTENGKERLVESASINKSLFVLAQCVEAISRKSPRIPYRESKMTRILSLGQNNGLTIMILNLAPVKSFHLDTLSSLNFANRTKTVQVKEIENEPMFKGEPRAIASAHAPLNQRQPLRPLTNPTNNTKNAASASKKGGKPAKEFFVYADRATMSSAKSQAHYNPSNRRSGELKRALEPATNSAGRPSKAARVGESTRPQEKALEEMVERKVEEILAARAMNEPSKPLVEDISEQVQRRLEMLEQKIEKKQDARAEGLTYLLMAKQHHVRGEEISALKMYQLALPYFPNNEKLTNKMRSLEAKLRSRRKDTESVGPSPPTPPHATTQISVSQASRIEKPVSLASLALPPSSTSQNQRFRRKATEKLNDLEYQEEPGSGNDDEDDLDNDFPYKRVKPRKPPTTARAARLAVFRDPNTNPNLQHDTAYNLANGNVRSSSLDFDAHDPQTPRTRHLLHIINTRDLTQLKALRGVGTKKAESILESLNINNNSNNKKKSHSCFAADADGEENDVDVLGDDDDDDDAGCLRITSLKQLGGLKGVGSKTVENMRNGVVV